MDKDKAENADFLNDINDEDELSFPKSVDSSSGSKSFVDEDTEALVFNVMELHFSVGEIFWRMSSGKKISLFHSGDWIRKDYLKKFIDAGKSIEIESIVNKDFCSKGLELFEAMTVAEEEDDKNRLRVEIIEWLCCGYWDKGENVGLLDLVFVCEQTFFKFSPEEEAELFEMSGDLFKRSSVVSSLLVSLAIVMGYSDINLLSDLYHLAYLFDISLDESVLSTNLLNALESERISPKSWGGGLGEAEITFFKTHSEEGVKKGFSMFDDFFNNPGLLHFIETHHERINGQGFPLGLVEGEISDLEGLIIFVNNRFPYSNLDLKSGDAIAFFKKLMEKDENVDAVLTNRIKKVITNEFENCAVEHAKYLEVSGI